MTPRAEELRELATRLNTSEYATVGPVPIKKVVAALRSAAEDREKLERLEGAVKNEFHYAYDANDPVVVEVNEVVKRIYAVLFPNPES